MSDRWKLRLIGAAFIVGTPILGIFTFAMTAVAIGEDRLEGADGTTALGNASIAVPAAIGVALIIWSFTNAPTPNLQAVLAGAAGLGAALVALGVWSIARSTAGDANIGGALLALVGAGLLGAGGVGLLRRRGTRSQPPPPAPRPPAPAG